MKYLLFIIILVVLTSCKKEKAEKSFINSDKLEYIKPHESEIPEGFLLFEEYLSKPGQQANIQIRQRWERDTIKNELNMTEEDSVFLDESHLAFCFQIWYRSNKKEKIEINIIICTSNSEIDKTVEDYTTKLFSQQFEINDVPIVGERSWIPSGLNYSSYSIMFLRANVFSRIYANLYDQDIEDLKVTVNNIASIIDTRILSEIN